MHRCTMLLTISVAALGLTAAAAQQPPAAQDAFGDPLPDGAVARLGTLRWRHGSSVLFAAFLADGKSVISVDGEKVIRVCEYPSGKEIRRIGQPPVALMAKPETRNLLLTGGIPVALSKDGMTIAVSYDASEVCFFDVATGKRLQSLPLGVRADFRYGVGTLAISPDGKQLATMQQDGVMRFWDLAQAKLMAKFGGMSAKEPSFDAAFAYSPDGKFLVELRATIGDQKLTRLVQIWDSGTCKKLHTIKIQDKVGATAIALAPDNNTLAISGFEGSITLVETATGNPVRSWQTKSRTMTALVFSHDGSKLYSRVLHSYQVVEWDVASGKEVRLLDIGGPDLPSQKLAPDFQILTTTGPQMLQSPDGNLLVLAGLTSALRFIDVATGKGTGAGIANAASMTGMHYSPDGRHLCSSAADGSVHQWDAGTGKDLGALAPSKPFTHHLISPDGKYLLLHFLRRAGVVELTLVEAATGKDVGTFADYPRDGHIVFSPNGKMLAVLAPGKKRVSVYEVSSAKQICTAAIDPDKMSIGGTTRILAFSPDGKMVAAPFGANAVGIWQTANGQRIGDLLLTDPSPILSGVFSPDGRCLALEKFDGTVSLVELASGRSRGSFGGKLQAVKPVTVGLTSRSPAVPVHIAFAHQGQTLILAGPDRVIRTWDIVTGQEVAAFKGHSGVIESLAVAPDGKTFASASADTTGLIWDLTRVVRPVKPIKMLAKDGLDAHWQTLLQDDAANAFAAICALVASPQETVAMCKERIQPAAPIELKRLKALIADLDSDQFKVRQQATAEVALTGEVALPAIDKALAANPALETKKQLVDLRKQLTAVVQHGERLRIYRAVEALERIGTAEARQVLEAFAAGAPTAFVTTTAQDALARLIR
jgi:WD40 repeat protein